MKKIGILLLIILISNVLFAQEVSSTVEMATGLRSSGKIYVVVLTIAVIFAGISIYLFLLDKKISKLEKETN